MKKEKISITALNRHHINEKSKSLRIWYFLKSVSQIVIFGKSLQSSKISSHKK